MQPLYYIPRITEKTPGLLAGFPFLQHIADADLAYTFCRGNGPDGVGGIILTVEGKANRGVGYYPEDQHWHCCENGAFWVGWVNDHAPRPKDLQRPEMIAGHTVKLEDGNEWVTPLARRFPQGTALPQSLILGPDGEWITDALPRYVQLCQQAETVYQWLMQDDVETLAYSTQINIAVQALASNYRVSKWEISALRLFTDANIQQVLGALIDLPTILAKIDDTKKNADANSLTPGD